MVERSLSMREALGSMPRFSKLYYFLIFAFCFFIAWFRLLFFALNDVSLAERSKAPDSSSGGAIRVGSNPTADIDIASCKYTEVTFGNFIHWH
jgi:hypothetical protein